jgi:hypothetical protein
VKQLWAMWLNLHWILKVEVKCTPINCVGLYKVLLLFGGKMFILLQISYYVIKKSAGVLWYWLLINDSVDCWVMKYAARHNQTRVDDYTKCV